MWLTVLFMDSLSLSLSLSLSPKHTKQMFGAWRMWKSAKPSSLCFKISLRCRCCGTNHKDAGVGWNSGEFGAQVDHRTLPLRTKTTTKCPASVKEKQITSEFLELAGIFIRHFRFSVCVFRLIFYPLLFDSLCLYIAFLNRHCWKRITSLTVYWLRRVQKRATFEVFLNRS